MDSAGEVLFALTSKYSNPNSISIEEISSTYEKEKGELSFLVSVIHGGQMFKSALFQRIVTKSPFSKMKVKSRKLNS